MATLANILWRDSRSAEGGNGAQWDPRTDSESARGGIRGSEPADGELYQLRPLPNEDVFLLIKRFDNTGVVRQADPRAGRTAWKAIGASCVAATLLIGLLLPGAYRLLAGYRIDQLKQAREESIRELRTLEYDEARLIRMERVNEVARSREFAAPTSEQVQFVQPKDSVASLRKP